MVRFGLAVVCGVVCLAPAGGQSPEAKKGTIAYVRKLQTPGGGFVAAAADKGGKAGQPSLRATSSAVRALKYLGGDLPDREACVKFVENCFDPASGGFSDQPGKPGPDVFTTAVGIMAVAELKMPVEKYKEAVLKYLAENVKTFDDIRIAVAGLERIGAKSPRNDAWVQEAGKLRIPDAADGEDKGAARTAASLMVTFLRLGGKVEYPAGVKVLKAGQRLSGGWVKADTDTADLETTYRVMRAFMMLKERPADVEGVRSFVAKCRNSDGGYGVAPGEPSNVSATYFAAIILHWLPPE